MNATIVGLISLAVGCAMVLWRDRFARKIIEEQNRFWGFSFGGREEMRSKLIVLIVGTGVVAFGLLLLLGIQRFRA